MLENAYYSVISPEGCSTILFGSAVEAGRAADALRLTAPDLLETGVMDGVITEPPGGAPADPLALMEDVRGALAVTLGLLSSLPPEELIRHRHTRFRALGTPASASSASSASSGSCAPAAPVRPATEIGVRR